MDQKKQVANILGDRKAAADERIKEELSEEPLFEHTASIQSCSRSIESEPEVQATVSIDRPTTSDETLNATLQPNSSSQGVQDAISDDDHHDSKSQVVAPGPSDSLFESNVVEPFEFAHNVRPTRSITLRAHVHSPPPMSSNACRPPINESPLLLSSHSLPCLTDLSMAAVDCNRSNPMSPSHLADALVGQLSLDNGELVDEQSVIQLHFHAQSIGHPHSQSKRRVDGQDERSQVEHLSRNFVTRRSKHRTNRMKRSKSAQSNSSMLLQRSLSCSVGMMAPNLMRAPPVAATDHDHRHRHHHRSKSKHKDTNKSLDKHTFYFSSSSVHQTSASASSVADSLSSSYSSSSSSDSGSTSRTARAQLSARQRLILTSLCCLAFASQCSMSIIAPFFPYEASAKGISESVYGLVFSIHAFVVMVFSPLLGIWFANCVCTCFNLNCLSKTHLNY